MNLVKFYTKVLTPIKIVIIAICTVLSLYVAVDYVTYIIKNVKLTFNNTLNTVVFIFLSIIIFGMLIGMFCFLFMNIGTIKMLNSNSSADLDFVLDLRMAFGAIEGISILFTLLLFLFTLQYFNLIVYNIMFIGLLLLYIILGVTNSFIAKDIM